jgi:hypothetical protein
MCLSRSRSGGEGAGRAPWSAEFTSGCAFHNALRGLKPRRQAVGSSFVPAWGHRRKSTLITFALEAEPAVAVFGGDRRTPVKRNPASLRRFPALRTTSERRGPAWGRPPVNLSSLCRGGRDQPHLPPLAPCVEERPITHRRSSVAGSRAKSMHMFALQGRCQKAGIQSRVFLFFRASVSACRAFSPRRDCRS